MEDFDADRTAVIRRAKDTGIDTIITVGIDLKSSLAALALSEANEGVYATVGIHPHNAEGWNENDLEHLAKLACNTRKVVAWGEIGLDFNRNYAPQEKQISLFKAQLSVARSLGLPVVIHDRDAHKTVLEILKRYGGGDAGGVIHCFSGDIDLATSFIKLGYFISIPGTVTYKKAPTVKAVAALMPLERLILETDAPFLSPVPFRGKRNEPSFVKYTALEVARLKGISFERLADSTTQNTINLFRIDSYKNHAHETERNNP
jgi:TatD DNase family protein